MPADRPCLYLIDGSSYIYRAFHALPSLTSPRGVPTQAVYGFTTMLLKLLGDVEPAFLVVIFDAPGRTFRDDLYESYKAHRPSVPDDLRAQIPLIHDVVAAFRLCKVVEPGVEADDVIATLVRRYAADCECVVITGDKDLMQLVGPSVRLWDTMRDRWIDAAAVREKFGVAPDQVVDLMALMGDSSDNIPGVKGVGAKTAAALIEHFGDLDALLSRLDEVPDLKIRGAAKLAERLRAGADSARLSRSLVTLQSDVDIGLDLEVMRVGAPDSEALRKIFADLGFHTLLEQVVRRKAPPRVVVEPITGSAAIADRVGAILSGSGAVAVATQTPDGPVVTTAAATVLLCDGDNSAALVELDTDDARQAVATAFAVAKARVVGYDLKQIGHSLAAAGILLPADGFDVMVASYLVDPTAANDLSSVVTEHLGGVVHGDRQDAESIASALVYVRQLASPLAERMRECNLIGLFDDLETPLISVLARIETRGMAIDTDRLAQLSTEYAQRLDSLMHDIYEAAGHEFNIHSPPQLRQVLFDEIGLSTRGVKKGKTGYSTDIDVLTKLSSEHPLPAKILEYRALSKLKSTYVDALPLAVNAATGRLHTTLHQTVAATGRLSSSDPNLQNIPIRGDEGRRIREAFVAPPGRVLIAADYSQIELRVLAHLSADPVLQDAFRLGEDVHARTAAEVFGVLPGTVTAEMRRAAKVINFGILYGMGPQRLARDLGISIGEAKQYIDNYFARYAGVRRFLEATLATARERGVVTTLLGRRRPVPELSSGQRGIVQAAERIAANTPIQGSAADIIKVAMLGIDKSLAESELDAFLILQVHDELLVECNAADAERVSVLLRESMEGAMDLSVPLQVEIGIGPSWAAAH